MTAAQAFDSKTDYLSGTSSAWSGYRLCAPSSTGKESVMFGWAITFLIVAIIAGIFGFAGVAGTAAWIAKILFAVGLVMFLALLAAGRRPPTL
jgi:uncharacterized membrane protein YtjA (UPF0391 family)